MLPEECDVEWNGEEVEQHDQHQYEIPVSSKVAQGVDDVTWTYGKKWLKIQGADPTSGHNLFLFSRIKKNFLNQYIIL